MIAGMFTETPMSLFTVAMAVASIVGFVIRHHRELAVRHHELHQERSRLRFRLRLGFRLRLRFRGSGAGGGGGGGAGAGVVAVSSSPQPASTRPAPRVTVRRRISPRIGTDFLVICVISPTSCRAYWDRFGAPRGAKRRLV